MRKMINYPKIKRIPVTGLRVRGKDYLAKVEVKTLLEDEVVIEEKLDGKTYHQDIAYHRVFYEDMNPKHTVYRHVIQYRALPPTLQVAFDVWSDENKRFLPYEEKTEFLRQHGYVCVPLIFKGHIDKPEDLLKFLGRPSAFGAERIEGIVVKNYEKQLFAKVVDPLFEDLIDAKEIKKSLSVAALS